MLFCKDIQPLPFERKKLEPERGLYQVHLYYMDDSWMYLDRGPLLGLVLLYEGLAMLCRPWSWKAHRRR